ncbi:DUF3099 domain-containing protein [Planctomonas sp. JC2975]|uniref:DUF3099 domain-containing protein n=1 Tax=Planctomonas sp. JC2975 TaxID=2729626 RepID=UPI001472D78E|nr:DUF3099 domain-containing protein [Planctomonas sp. JC2975]NNC10491.1 DUF3099 domain-containing protein [Planctomonas sp. JC2975]
MKHESITSLPPSPAVERRNRMLEYTVMMSIRVICLISLLWVRGWWLVIPAAGAIFLPYFAVVVANATRSKGGTPERPGALATLGPQQGASADGPESSSAPTSDDAASDATASNATGSEPTESAGAASDGSASDRTDEENGTR